jgi:hypothetical protein
MNPPEVNIEAEVEDLDVIMEYATEILEMVGEVMREFTEEEIEIMRKIGEFFEQWDEFEFVEYV